MSLHAHNIKKYFECIELCEARVPLEENNTELKARAYLAMINSYSELHNYDNVESHLGSLGNLNITDSTDEIISKEECDEWSRSTR
ncbi:hypothetical protein [Brevibacillus laterosporus]|uniref:hypothetical protein n=1 Tax=Brevibacillus laterosporus TaxID=1465 RepID=UPI0020D1BD6A|nr:hypothetical protein [Brevibacillus laterosporus]